MKTQYVLGNIGFSVAGAYYPGGLNALISPISKFNSHVGMQQITLKLVNNTVVFERDNKKFV